MAKVKAAIIGSGNIGTDLMIKIMRHSRVLEMAVLVGIDPASDGLARARRLSVATTHEGIAGLQKLDVWPEIGIVFDATSASAHKANSAVVTGAGKVMIDLTPAANRSEPERAGAGCGVDTRAILAETGRRRMVGGQEDMIVDIALDLAAARARSVHRTPLQLD